MPMYLQYKSGASEWAEMGKLTPDEVASPGYTDVPYGTSINEECP